MEMKFAFISAPFDFSSPVEGAKNGPSAILFRLLPRLKEAKVEYKIYPQLPLPNKLPTVDPKRRHAKEALLACGNYYSQVCDAIYKGFFPIVLGGEHTVAFASLKASSRGKRQGLLWVDAHGDFNTPQTTLTGNVHGMVVQMISSKSVEGITELEKELVAPQDAVLFGTRDLDSLERELFSKSKVRNFEMVEIRGKGFEESVLELEAKFAKLDGVHVSLDLDSLSPELVPGISLPVEGGFSLREVEQLLSRMSKLKPTCLDVVEYNPSLDHNHATADVAAKLIVCFISGLKANGN